jgi:hypothetical protein|tara:strand:- start:432 stop:617 length:186 start_codon:yes stop_codon:yes gene_type:complete
MEIKYNPILGAFVNAANDEIVSQQELKLWAAENPMPVAQGLTTPKELGKFPSGVETIKKRV